MNDHQQLIDYRENVIKKELGFIGNGKNEVDARKWYQELCEHITDLVIEDGLKKNKPSYKIESDINDSCDLMINLIECSGDGSWSHCWEFNFVQQVGKFRFPSYNKPAIKEVTHLYLNQNYKSAYLDGIILHMLISCEYFPTVRTFLDETDEWIQQPRLKQQSPLTKYTSTLLMFLLFTVASISLTLSDKAPSWIEFLNLLLVIIDILIIYVGIRYLPKIQSVFKKTTENAREILLQMSCCYRLFKTEQGIIEKISVHHIQARCEHAANYGAEWDRELYLLIDDISMRQGYVMSIDHHYDCQHGRI